jgi:alkylation response protein AidB-like acyl-CoA dehydrogenase
MTEADRSCILPCPAGLPKAATGASADHTVAQSIEWLRDYARRRINSRLMDERRCIAPHVVLDFGNQGLLGMQIPKAWGGRLALSTFHSLRLVRALASVDLTLTSFVGVNNMLGVAPLLRFGTAAAHERYLPGLAAGRILAAFAYTEPVAGSNPLDIVSTGRAGEQGGYVLNGTKLWSGSAAWSSLINVFVNRLGPDGQRAGHLALCVPTDTAGMRQGPEALTMGLRGMVQNSVHLHNAKVDPDHLLGSVGGGLAVANEAMLMARLWVASSAVGAMRRALQLAGRYARRRRIGAAQLIDSDLVCARLASCMVAAQTLEVLVEQMARDIDTGVNVPPEAFAAAKAFGGEWLHEVSDRALQTLGGRGYIETNYLTQLARDARVLRIFEGPTDTMLLYVGKRALEGGAVLFDYIERHLGDAETANRLRALLGAVHERRMRVDSRSDQLGDVLAGELAGLHLVRACLMQSPGRARCLPWLDARIAHAASVLPACSTPPLRSSVEQWLDEIDRFVGDIEPSAPDEDRCVDPYLAKDFA